MSRALQRLGVNRPPARKCIAWVRVRARARVFVCERVLYFVLYLRVYVRKVLSTLFGDTYLAKEHTQVQ